MTSTRATGAALRVLVVLIAGLLASAITFSAPAAANSSAEQQFVQLINQARASNGLPALSTNGELHGVAARWSAQMASDGNLRHNPNLGSQVSNWSRLTENVGMRRDGQAVSHTVQKLHEALMASSGHRANILDRNVSQVGVGVRISDNGTVWVTQIFRQPASSSSGGSSSGSSGSSSSSSSSGGGSASGSTASSGGSASTGGSAPSSANSAPPRAPEPEPEPVVEPDPAPKHRAIPAPRPSMDELLEVLERDRAPVMRRTDDEGTVVAASVSATDPVSGATVLGVSERRGALAGLVLVAAALGTLAVRRRVGAA
jgi:uncharacterized protein YkwD